MGTESKGRAWFGKIFNKLETILVEVDTFTSQSTLCLSDPPGWESVRCEPKEAAEDQSSETSNTQQHYDRVDSPSSKSPSDPPSLQNFDVSGYFRVEERFQGDSLKEDLSATSLPDGEEILSARSPLLEEEYCDGNLTSTTTLGDDEEPIITDEESQITNTLTLQKFSDGESSVSTDEEKEEEVRFESCRDVISTDSQSTQSSLESVIFDEYPVLAAFGISDSNLNPIPTKIPDVAVLDNVAKMRSSNEGNSDDVFTGKFDVAPSDTNSLDSMALQEDTSDVDDNALYAVRVRTKKLRSFKRKILDALTSKRRREKEYEHLPIWFGDADMGSDLGAGEDSKDSSQELEPEESQWELL